MMAARRPMHAIGIFSIFLAAILFGVAGAAAKMLFVADVSPLDLTAVRTFVACAVLGPIMALLPGRPFHVPPPARPLVVAAGVLFVLVNATFYLAIDMMNVAAAITLEYTSPFFVLVLGAILGTRRMSLRDSGIVGLSLAGCALLTGTGGEWVHLSAGLLVGLACGFAFALFNMVGNACKSRGIGATALTFWSFAVSSMLWTAALPFLGVHTLRPSPEMIAHIGFIAVIATIIPYWLLLFGLRHVDALPATVIGLLDPLAAGIAAYLLLGETLTPPNLAGIALVSLSVVLVTLSESRTAGPPAARADEPPRRAEAAAQLEAKNA
ncbi:EamA family transporter [Azospirillum picis]|uniref:Drug/metabolite transporter (DMT)-like permease n=2 Tax=Azospirillum picis TaxID=488438 RepID=A0ABU0MLF0_9PROT|nr:DMT family transporter [Azospirillum picis]MDQ0534293.1 drug/metabolite transporter (DMT)-like permease [Azospirillum picis]